jgi:hypothetical protein
MSPEDRAREDETVRAFQNAPPIGNEELERIRSKTTPFIAADVIIGSPIETPEGYEVAILEVERLRGAALGTPDGDRLDALATLIAEYEAKHVDFLKDNNNGTAQD